MSTVTIEAGHVQDPEGTLISKPDPVFPFQEGVGIYSKKLAVGTDFISGDDVVIDIQHTDKIRYASVLTNTGAVKAYAEAASTNGRKITISSATTDLQVLIIYNP